MPHQIKICGITNLQDLALVGKVKADFGGVIVEVPNSSRSLTVAQARELFQSAPLPMVAVTVDLSTERLIEIAEYLNPFALQLHGHETPGVVRQLKSSVSCELWKAIHLPASESGETADTETTLAQINDYSNAGIDRFVVDATVTIKGEKHLGGTGKTVDWNAVAELCRKTDKPVMLAGGITPQNVARALQTVRPAGVDVSSGVELTKGRKDPDKVLEFVTQVRGIGAKVGYPI